MTESLRAALFEAGAPDPTPADVVVCMSFWRDERGEDVDAMTPAQRESKVVRWMCSPTRKRTPVDGGASMRAAYERGVAKGKLGPYGLPATDLAELVDVVRVFARKRDGTPLEGPTLHEWIEVVAEEFASWLLAESAKDPRACGFYSSYGPRGCRKFLNETEANREAKAVP